MTSLRGRGSPRQRAHRARIKAIWFLTNDMRRRAQLPQIVDREFDKLDTRDIEVIVPRRVLSDITGDQ